MDVGLFKNSHPLTRGGRVAGRRISARSQEPRGNLTALPFAMPVLAVEKLEGRAKAFMRPRFCFQMPKTRHARAPTPPTTQRRSHISKNSLQSLGNTQPMVSIHDSDPCCPACNNHAARFYSTKGVFLHCQWCEMTIPLRNAIDIQNGTFKFYRQVKRLRQEKL
jgi:hypothetical protein